jgi:hypothetical protein
MSEHNSYWMRFSLNGNLRWVAVVAPDLDEAFRMVSENYKVDQSNITYRNREIDVLLPF